jgi:hypothetical protein
MGARPVRSRKRPSAGRSDRDVSVAASAVSTHGAAVLVSAQCAEQQFECVGGGRRAAGPGEACGDALGACAHVHRVVNRRAEGRQSQRVGEDLRACARGGDPPGDLGLDTPNGTTQTGTPAASALCVIPIPPWQTTQAAFRMRSPCGSHRSTCALAGTSNRSGSCATVVATTWTSSELRARSAISMRASSRHAEVEDVVEVEPVGEMRLEGVRRPVAAFNVVAVRETAAELSRV